MKTTAFAITSLLLAVNAQAEYLFQPEGCEFSVTFPDTPTIEEKVSKTTGEVYQQVTYGVDGGFVSADCQPYDRVAVPPEENAKISHGAFIKNWSLTPVEYQYETTELGESAWYSGKKILDGAPMIYETANHYGEKTWLVIYAGILTQTEVDTRDIRFKIFDSVSR